MKTFYFILLLLQFHPIYSQDTKVPDTKPGFIENKGQLYDQNKKQNNNVLYLLEANGLNIQLRRKGFSYDFYEIHKTKNISNKESGGLMVQDSIQNIIYKYNIHRIDFDFKDVNPKAEIIVEGKSASYNNYYNVPEQNGVTKVYTYQKVRYKNIYNNIDLLFFVPDDPEKPVEYNFIIHKGGNTSDIKFSVNGAKSAIIKNTLAISVKFGEMRETIPMSWVETESGSENISVSYKKISNKFYGFTLNKENPEGTIIIDPVPIRLWGTFFGGTRSAFPTAICKDSNNDFYVGGSTSSPGLIATTGTFQSTISGGSDGYISKFNPDGQQIWGTYYPVGPRQMTIDADFNVIFSGSIFTTTNNVSTPGSFKPVKGNYNDAYLVKLNNSGLRLWGTYYGGEQNDYGLCVITDAINNIYIAGLSNSGTGIATTGSLQENLASAPGGNSDAYIVKFLPGGNREWASYYGGSDPDGFYAADVSDDGYVYVCGTSSSPGLATAGSYQPSIASDESDGLIVKFNNAGGIVWSTYVGSTEYESIGRAKLAGSNLYIEGGTASRSGIATPGAFITEYPANDGGNYYIMNFNVATQQIVWGTYFNAQITGIDANSSGNVYFCGPTYLDTGISTPDAYMPVRNNYSKSYLIKLDNMGQRVWGTYYGGDKAEQSCVTAVDNLGDIYLYGMTNGSITGISTPGAHQLTNDNSEEITYIAKFRDCMAVGLLSTNSPVCPGNSIELHANGGTSYLWTGPDNFVSSQQNPVIANSSVVKSGTYICYVSGTSGCDGPVSTEVVVSDTTSPLPNLPVLPVITGNCTVTISVIPEAIDNCGGTITASTTSPLIYNMVGTYTINWMYSDAAGNTTTQRQDVIVSNRDVSLNTNINFSQCEGNTTFNLTTLQPLITTTAGTGFSFYTSQLNALAETNPIINPATFIAATDQDVYAVVIFSDGCRALSVLHLTLSAVPVVHDAVTSLCRSSGMPAFDLTQVQNDIDPSGLLTIQYYDSLLNLQNNIPISIATNYTPASSMQTIYAKGINSNGCSATALLQLISTAITELELPDYYECATTDGRPVAFSLPQHESNIISLLPSGTYTSSYYDNYSDAYNGTTTTLPATYNLTSGFSTIYYRISGASGCPYIAKLKLQVSELPVINLQNKYTICSGATVTVSVQEGFDSYEWSTGETSASIVVDTAGAYTIKVGKISGNTECFVTKNFNVEVHETPFIERIDIEDFKYEENIVTIYPYNSNYSYSVNGVNYQDSNIFTNLESGIYTLHVKDNGSCGVVKQTVVVLMYPKYFTPNADGNNDYWHIPFSTLDNELIVYIYDRYGKLLTSLNNSNKGWDGLYNGAPMPATDYWFTAIRKEEIVLKGHFSLLR